MSQILQSEVCLLTYFTILEKLCNFHTVQHYSLSCWHTLHCHPRLIVTAANPRSPLGIWHLIGGTDVGGKFARLVVDIAVGKRPLFFIGAAVTTDPSIDLIFNNPPTSTQFS